jgi:hypothetical protein
MDSIRAVPIEQLGTVADEPTDPMPFLDWASTVSRLPGPTCQDLLATILDRSATAPTMVEIRHLGGAFRAPDPARPGACERLDGEYLVSGLGFPIGPQMIEPIQHSLRALSHAIAAVDLDRVTPTFIDGASSARRAFDQATLLRLRGIKQRTDPHRLFQANLPLG